jgi:hypothetical protein
MRYATLTAFILIAVASAFSQGTTPSPSEQFTRLAARSANVDASELLPDAWTTRHAQKG